MNTDSHHSDAHLSESDVAAYLDGAVLEDERRRIEAHLSFCDECRREVITSRDAVSSAPTVTSRSKWPIRGLGIAVAAGLMLVVATTLTRNAADRDTVRDGSIPGGVAAAISVIAPADGATISADRRLVWRKAADGASYRVTIADDSAQPMHSIAVQDTSVAIPPALVLQGGRKYFWYVDAILPDGTTASSGLKAFTVK